MPRFFVLFLLAISLPANNLWAQSGRLPNGQAYRTDAAGNQIVDYIAELEVKNEALERRIRGLVNEVEDLRSYGSNSSKSLKERELISGAPLSNRSSGSFSPIAAVPGDAASGSVQPKQKAASAGSCGESECEIFISEVRSRGQRAIQKQAEQIERIQQEKNECREQYDAFRASLSDQKAETGDVTRELQQAKLQSSAREDLLKQREGELATQRALVSSLEGKVRKLEQELETQSASNARVAAVRVSESASSPVTPAKASLRQQAIPQLQQAEISDAERERVRALYASVIKLRNKRDQLFRAYKNSTLTVQKRSIRSSKGQLPEQLLGAVKSTQSLRELRVLEKEGNRLERLVKADIGLIQRLRNQ